MKRLISFLFCSVLSFSQTVGVVTSVSAVPPTPGVIGKLTATAGVVSCVVAGNKFQATAVTISCVVNSVVIPDYTIPIQTGAAYTFDHRFNADAVTFIIRSDSLGNITGTAAANDVSAAAPTNF